MISKWRRWKGLVIPILTIVAFAAGMAWFLYPVYTGDYKLGHSINKDICESWVIKHQCKDSLEDCVRRVKQQCY